jgi:hypothetical protein
MPNSQWDSASQFFFFNEEGAAQAAPTPPPTAPAEPGSFQEQLEAFKQVMAKKQPSAHRRVGCGVAEHKKSYVRITQDRMQCLECQYVFFDMDQNFPKRRRSEVFLHPNTLHHKPVDSDDEDDFIGEDP